MDHVTNLKEEEEKEEGGRTENAGLWLLMVQMEFSGFAHSHILSALIAP